MMNETYGGHTYQQIRVLGEGGNGCVYLVLHRRTMQLYAMKKIPLNGQVWMGVEREYIRHLTHPGLPKIQDLFEEDGFAYLVMEFITGQTLKERKQEKGILSEKELLDCFIQLMDILEFLHNRGRTMIHADIKPSNLMLDTHGRLVLLDFGASLLSNTDASQLQGTYRYASPEQVRCEEDIDERSDLYSAGKTFQVLGEGNISRSFRRILRKCSQPDREKRYRTARAVLRAAVRCRRRWKKRILFYGILTVCCLFMNGIYVQEQKQKRMEEQYQFCVQSHQLSHLLSAVKSFPDREKAYHRILKLYLSDELFSEEESASVEQLMLEFGKRFQENRESYAEFCYELGIAYWFYAPMAGGKQYAVFWFEESEKGILSAEQKQCAEFYKALGQYYLEKARQQRTGEKIVSWSEFCCLVGEAQQLKDIQKLDTKLKRKLQGEIFGQWYEWLPEFQVEQISIDELESVLEEIQKIEPNGLKNEIQFARESARRLYEEGRE